ncbi:MAG: pyridoxal-phosphate dependent enzyme [Shewanella sp.]
MKLAQTPIQAFQFLHHQLLIKRDDLLHPLFSGNKARKFYGLLALESGAINTLIGYGSPQANSLLSMAALAQLKGWKLEFYVDHIAGFLLENPTANYQRSLALGANIIPINSIAAATGMTCQQYIEGVRLQQSDAAQCLFVPEGGRCQLAYEGVAKLADEIIADYQGNSEPLDVFLPSGTGTTAFFLHRRFKECAVDINVITCAAVGGSDYLRAQFNELGAATYGMPEIVTLAKKYHFGKPYLEGYQLWQAVQQSSGIEFELLYDPIGFLALKQRLMQARPRQILYLHQGGLIGNESMLPRYRRKFEV